MVRTLVPLGVAAATTLLVRAATAGCGFYAPPATATGAAIVNDADQVSYLREGNRVALTMSTNYKGPTEDFAMIVPVPVVLKKEAVKTLSPAIFTHLEKLTAPRVVEMDEDDPCRVPTEGAVAASGGAPGGAIGGGFGKGGGGGYGVTVEAAFVTGEYEIVVLSATESDGLERWLVDHKYKIPEGAATALAPYVTAQQKFVVAKVDKTKVVRDAAGVVVLSPLRFVYETNDLRLPVRLGLLNAPKGGKQDLIVYLLAKGKRLEAANYPNAFVPTNLDVVEGTEQKLGPFYASLFDATLAKAGGRAVVTEYAWNAGGCGLPCTSTPLVADEIKKLGADDLVTGEVAPHEFTLTRVHTRYDAATLTEDIVFRTGEPVSGGRDGDPGAEGESASKGAPADAFQARYVVRHLWKGPIACEKPVRGVFRPHHGADAPALSVAAAPRDVVLASAVVSPVKQLGLSGTSPAFGAMPTLPAAAPKKKAEKTEAPAPAPEPSRLPWILGAGAALVSLGLVFVVLRRRA